MELEFKKYPKLTNHYNLEKEPVFGNKMGELYYSDEKIDGSNTQMAFLIENNKIKDTKVGSRNHFIEADDKNNIAKVYSFVDKVKEAIEFNINLLPKDCVVRVFGEIFGAKIQQTKYDVTKDGNVDYRIFDVFIELPNDDTYVLGQSDLHKLLANLDETTSYLKNIYLSSGADTLQDKLEHSLLDKSHYGDILCEGEVYHPLDTFKYTYGTTFPVVKRKHEEFMEVSRKPRKKKKKSNVANPELIELTDKVSDYVTERRLDNILSHGDISLEPKNIGLLIKEMNKDISEEYLKENPDTDQYLLGQALRRLNKDIALTVKNRIGM